jgi:hypothetical protein
MRLLLLATLFASAAPKTLDLVLSHFHEDAASAVDFVNHVRGNLTQVRVARVFVYTHDANLSDGVFPSDWTVRRFENIGRESYSYVLWLLDHTTAATVHEVSDFVWFSQAAPELDGWNERTNLMRRARELLAPHTGMLALGLTESARCDWGGSFSGTPWQHMREMYAMATRTLCNEWWPTFMNGEFIVSKKRVLRQPPSMWRYIKELLEAPPGHFIHHEGETPERPHVYDSTRVDPVFGHMMERLWNPLFGCLDTLAPMRCCGPRETCNDGDCQCLD